MVAALVKVSVVAAAVVRPESSTAVRPAAKASVPALTATAPEPAEVAVPRVTVPALTIRPSARALAPASTRLPAPVLVREPDPAKSPPKRRVPAVFRIRLPLTVTRPAPRSRAWAAVA